MSIDYQALNRALAHIIDCRMRLGQLSYDAKEYDELEEELHDMEDELIDIYGDYLEDILVDVHEEVCPKVEVFSPIAYIPREAVIEQQKKDTYYRAPYGQGAWIDHDRHGRESYLVLLPNPLRIELIHSPDERQIVWQGN